MKFFGPKDIKLFVRQILLDKRDQLKGKIVFDIPAGSGYSSAILKEIGAEVNAYDLFPEFFKVNGLNCKHADLSKNIPAETGSADFVICQEGIEHIPNQIAAFSELNRILKKNGTLLLTTPNESKLRSRVSHLLAESEYFFKTMPPNEIDSIWFSDTKKSNDIYFGHMFLVGVQKLRLFAKLAGFRIKKIHHTRVNHTSFILFVIFYPFILLVNLLTYRKAANKIESNSEAAKKDVYRESLKLGIDPRILLDGHMVIEFEKEMDFNEVSKNLYGKLKSFDVTT